MKGALEDQCRYLYTIGDGPSELALDAIDMLAIEDE